MKHKTKQLFNKTNGKHAKSHMAYMEYEENEDSSSSNNNSNMDEISLLWLMERHKDRDMEVSDFESYFELHNLFLGLNKDVLEVFKGKKVF